MRHWRLALLALLCCLTMRENVALVAGQAGDHRPPPHSEMPAPVEEGGADWLLVESECETAHWPAILVEPSLAATRSHGDATFHCCIDGREILNALHRLRI